MGIARVPIDPGYEMLRATSDGSNPVEIVLWESNPPQDPQLFVNAFATKNGVIDGEVEIAVGTGGQRPDKVTFTPPDSDFRWYHVVVIHAAEQASFDA